MFAEKTVSSIQFSHCFSFPQQSEKDMERSTDRNTKLHVAFGLFLFFLDAMCFAQVAQFYPTEALQKGTSVVMVGIAIGCFDVTGVFTSLFPVLVGRENNKTFFLWGASFRGLTTLCFGFTCFISSINIYNTLCIVIRSDPLLLPYEFENASNRFEFFKIERLRFS